MHWYYLHTIHYILALQIMWYSGLYHKYRPESQTHYTKKGKLLDSIRAIDIVLPLLVHHPIFLSSLTAFVWLYFVLHALTIYTAVRFFVVFLCLIVVFPGSFVPSFHTCILTECSHSSVLSRYLLSLIYALFFYTLPFLEQVSVTFLSPFRQPNRRGSRLSRMSLER